MPTIRQRKLAKAIVENMAKDKPLNKEELVVSSGYSEVSAQSSAGILMEQKGVQEALSDLGFNELSAKKVVESIMLNEKVDANARLKATDQVFKVIGSYAPEKSVNLNINTSTEAREKSKEAISKFLNGDDTGNPQ